MHDFSVWLRTVSNPTDINWFGMRLHTDSLWLRIDVPLKKNLPASSNRDKNNLFILNPTNQLKIVS